MLAFLRTGDELVVTRLDRLGRDNRDVLNLTQMERRFIKERQREGIEQARARGTYTGGRRRLDRAAIAAMTADGATPTLIARQLRCSRMQVYRVLRGK